ncbi:hypothetical protein Pmani_011244 [Petrolisthes manimaculis]|uniref:Uncharacterized protein n=1 Tax=Petrolisthes manimaculis TaxID=1843537 RepID=A0AAE1Q0F6_9EUCA|nr:hypothetical protein Pmani_011244 [Petrolisthes manimaculis]
MSNSGLEDIMKAAFGGVTKMLTGMKYSQNFRALRLVVEEVLRDTLNSVSSYQELFDELSMKAEASHTTKHWVNNLILQVFLMMIFVRVEWEGDWALHLWAVKEMFPFFFTLGHINYAGYCRLLKDVVDMKDRNYKDDQGHKEETASQMAYDAKDRTTIHEKLELCIHPLKHDEHPQGLVNIVTGKMNPDTGKLIYLLMPGKVYKWRDQICKPTMRKQTLSFHTKLFTLLPKPRRIKVISDDTDVFVLLAHYYHMR